MWTIRLEKQRALRMMVSVYLAFCVTIWSAKFSGSTWMLICCSKSTEIQISPPSHNICVRKKYSSTTAQESHHQQQRSVMTTTHCGHEAACSGTIQSVSKGYVQMEAWEVKGCPVLMCAGHGSLNFRRQRSKVHMKKCCWCKAEKRPVKNPVLVVLRWLIQAEFPAWINSNSALKFFAFIPVPLYSVETFSLSLWACFDVGWA